MTIGYRSWRVVERIGHQRDEWPQHAVTKRDLILDLIIGHWNLLYSGVIHCIFSCTSTQMERLIMPYWKYAEYIISWHESIDELQNFGKKKGFATQQVASGFRITAPTLINLGASAILFSKYTSAPNHVENHLIQIHSHLGLRSRSTYSPELRITLHFITPSK